MPLAALSRRQFAGFRTGNYPLASMPTKITFDTPWDLHKVKPSIFPVPPCVIFGRRSSIATPMPTMADEWSGRVSQHNASWDSVSSSLSVTAANRIEPSDLPTRAKSPYGQRFSQGATIVPRVLFVVTEAPGSPLGIGAGRRVLQPRRSANEKMPWKEVHLEPAVVETRFIFPMHLGETLLPFRLLDPLEVVLPWDGETLLDSDSDALDYYPGFGAWWKRANDIWKANRSSDRLSLLEQIDYQKKLSNEFPIAEHRVVYNASGMYLAASRIEDRSVVIDNSLYWGATSSANEALYLTAIMNSDVFTLTLRPLQSRGEHNPRHFHKLVFDLPFPTFNPSDSAHHQLVEAATHAELVAATIELPNSSFQSQRRAVRRALQIDGVAARLDGLVSRLLTSD
jgi:hypothetical protein